ncbi:MAG TPA: tetratricopeptide repeat protein [Opitutaceae bacterium]|nr:tetratricopeptide repeat protein [Opitutaceae bacterium]
MRAESRRLTVAACGVIAAATIAAYFNSFAAPFLFDDPSSIADNPTIRHLWPLWRALAPPHGGLTVSGRPVLNLSLAINYAISGTQVWSYHALNLTIHLCAGLALFGIVRRTLERMGKAGNTAAARRHAFFVALAAVLWWSLHPLQTESVTYIVQRAESLMALFYLLTIYCFVRGARFPEVGNQRSDAGSNPTSGFQPPRSGFWLPASVLCCLLGMASKEVMVSAPVIVFFYDRTFVSGTFAAAWKRHRGLHLALAGTWILLAYLVLGTGNRGGTSGFNVGIGWARYFATQLPAIAGYLRLTFWPHPLVFDYGTEWIQHAAEVIPGALAVITLAAGTLWALRRRPALGFCGMFFFAILAPTSLVPGMRQTMAEHRMYLALAPVLVVVVTMFFRCAGARSLLLFAAIAAGCGWLTVQRNRDYRSAFALWSDTVKKRPENAWAQNELGSELLLAGRPAEGAPHLQKALQLAPGLAIANNNYANLLVQEGRPAEAVAYYERTLSITPDYADAHYNLAKVDLQLGRLPEAVGHFAAVARLKPDSAEAQDNLGNALAQSGRLDESIPCYEAALRLNPNLAEAQNNWGNVLLQEGRPREAIGHYEAALRLKPDYADARYNLELAREQAGQPAR